MSHRPIKCGTCWKRYGDVPTLLVHLRDNEHCGRQARNMREQLGLSDDKIGLLEAAKLLGAVLEPSPGTEAAD